MEQFQEVCFWSDARPHFRSAELINFILMKLPQLYNKRFYMNYFVEYHGKNIVDGYFGVLSRWFSEGEAVQNIYTIEDLLLFFQTKAHTQQQYTNQGYLSMEFDIYSRTEPRTQIQQLIIDNFRSYMYFVKVGDKIFASTLSTLNSIDYT